MRLKVSAQGHDYEIEIERISRGEFEVNINGSRRRVRVLSEDGEQRVYEVDERLFHSLVTGTGARRLVSVGSEVIEVLIQDPKRLPPGSSAAAGASGVTRVSAQMPGKVVAVLKGVGDAVEAGQGLVVIESMKMQNELKSPGGGTVTQCHVVPEQTVEGGQLLFQIE